MGMRIEKIVEMPEYKWSLIKYLKCKYHVRKAETLMKKKEELLAKAKSICGKEARVEELMRLFKKNQQLTEEVLKHTKRARELINEITW